MPVQEDPAEETGRRRPNGPGCRRPRDRREPPLPRQPRQNREARARSAAIGAAHDDDRDILDQYLYEVSKTPLLTPEQEIALAKQVRAGDQEAMQELVKRNLRFVISVAKKYQNRGLPLTDLIGEGNVGLLTAARKFDPDQRREVHLLRRLVDPPGHPRRLARQGRTVRVPLNRTADLSRIVRTAEALRQELRREPTPEEIASRRGLSRTWSSRWPRSTPARSGSTRPLDPERRSLADRAVRGRGRQRRRGAERWSGS